MHKWTSKAAAVVLSLGLLCGCESVGVVSPQAAIDAGKDVVFVLGVAPENYKITIYPGTIVEGDTFKQDAWSIYRVFSAPVDGYLVWKGAPNEALAITGIRVLNEKGDLLGPDYGPCAPQPIMVFRAASAKVVYFGDLHYSLQNNRVLLRTLDRPEGARKYIDEKYPALRGRLESAKPEMLKARTLNNCAR